MQLLTIEHMAMFVVRSILIQIDGPCNGSIDGYGRHRGRCACCLFLLSLRVDDTVVIITVSFFRQK